jgi:hypothetical protein
LDSEKILVCHPIKENAQRLARQIEAEIDKDSATTNAVLAERNLYQDVVGRYV